MGLFDGFMQNADPDTKAAFNRGLIAAGLQLMQAKGRLFPAVAQAAQQGIGTYDQARHLQQQQEMQALQKRMMGYQLGNAQREADIAALPQKFYRAPSAPAVDATGGMETATEAPNNASGPGGWDAQGYYQALRGMAPMLAEQFKQAITPAPEKPIALGRDQRLVMPGGKEVVPAMPADAEEKDAFVRVMKLAGISPESEEGKRMLTSYLTKQATHPSPISINNSPYAPVMTVEGPNGPMAMQPGSRPGQAPQVVVNPLTGKPAVPVKDGGGAKTPAEIQRMNAAADTMSTLLEDYEKWLRANNPRDPSVQGNPAVRAEAQSRMKNIQLQFKELQALGALAGPDLAIMEAAITDPFTLKGVYYGKDGLMGQINQAKRLIDVRRQAIAAQSNGGKPAAPNSDPLGLR